MFLTKKSVIPSKLYEEDNIKGFIYDFHFSETSPPFPPLVPIFPITELDQDFIAYPPIL